MELAENFMVLFDFAATSKNTARLQIYICQRFNSALTDKTNFMHINFAN